MMDNDFNLKMDKEENKIDSLVNLNKIIITINIFYF